MQIDHLPVKMPIQIEASNGTRTWLKRIKRNVWKLDNPHNRDHARWGNHDEIQADLEHFIRTGYLPMSR